MASSTLPAFALAFILIGTLYLASGILTLDCALSSGLIVALAAAMIAGSLGFLVAAIFATAERDADRDV